MENDCLKKIKWTLKGYIFNSIYYRFERKAFGDKRQLNGFGKTKKVCFIIQRAEIFSSVQSIYDYMRTDSQFNVNLLVLPRFDHAQNKLAINTISSNLHFAEEIANGVEIINPYNENDKKFENIDNYKFDFIFLGLPYQSEYPPEYNFEYLSSLARLCYIPYGSSFADGTKMIRTTTPKALLIYVDYIFCDGDKTYKYCHSKLKYCKNIDGKKVAYNIGYPRFDQEDRRESYGDSLYPHVD